MLFTYFREAIHHLYSAKQRTLIALIGISIGIGAVIAMVSIGMIVGQETTRQFAGIGTDLMTITKSWEPKNENTPITLKTVLELPRLVPGIATVVPFIYDYGKYRFNSQPKPHDGEKRYLQFLGVTASFQELNKIQLQEGRFISDLEEKQSYVVLGCKVLTYPGFKTFKGKLVGKLLKIGNHDYLIIGVLKCIPTDSSIDFLSRYYDIDTSVFLPISTVTQHHYHNNVEIETLIVRMQPKVNYLLLSTLVKQYFAKRVKGLKVQVNTAKGLIKQAEKTSQRITFLLAAIGSISLLAGCIGIMNVMLTAVIERRREIGILRAIGAKRRDIRWQFLVEAVILSLIGGAFGMGLGITAAYGVAWFNEWQFFISSQVILLGVGVSSAVGIFFGFYPAHKAAKLDPITALRSE